MAQEEARLLNHNYIGTEHILLGLVREGEGVAAQVLAQLGVDLSRVRQVVVSLLEGLAASEATSFRADVEPATADLGAATSEAL